MFLQGSKRMAQKNYREVTFTDSEQDITPLHRDLRMEFRLAVAKVVVGGSVGAVLFYLFTLTVLSL